MKPEFDDEIDALVKLAEEVSGLNISHEELGITSGFHEASKDKNSLAEYVMLILNKTKKYGDTVNEMLLKSCLENIRNALNQIKAHSNSIVSLVETGVHDQAYPTQRTNIIQQFKNSINNLRSILIPYEHELAINEIRSKISASDYVQDEVGKIERLRDSVKRTASESEKILSNLQNKAMKQSVYESASSFSELKQNHKTQENVWLAIFVLASVLTVWAFVHAINTEFVGKDVQTAVSKIIKRLLTISLPAIFMKIALTKFNLERNLRIVYDHRESVLSQYKNFENAIGDEVEAKNEFRLELAKYIFSDPKTGYLGKDNTGLDFNINPVVNMIEKASRIAK